MRRVVLEPGAAFDAWRAAARDLLQQHVPPDQVHWVSDAQDSLLGDSDPLSDGPDAPAMDATPATRVPKEFPDLADAVIANADPHRHGLAYRLLWRLSHGEPKLLELVTDPDVARAREWAKSVSRDQHKMKAFVRFREVAGPDGAPVFIAWFEPDHYIVERVAPFFVRRFAGMRWSILTPYRSAHWDGESLSFGPGAAKGDAPSEDALEDLWRTYYASIFNPARLKVQAMKSEMPVKYWKNLPEARLIPGLVREAHARSGAMIEKEATVPRKKIAAPVRAAVAALPEGSLEQLRAEAQDCRKCDLWKPATQTVFGVGPSDARVMIVGEQPGDQEDLAGKPFIGPAGKLLDRALAEAGLDRAALYVTNTVKHFKFEPKGKFRLHKRADAEEQRACRPWLDAEIDRIRPAIVICMGSMAASNLLGSSFKLLKERGQWRTREDGTRLIATVHPSYLLRLPDEDARTRGFADFVADLRRVADALATLA